MPNETAMDSPFMVNPNYLHHLVTMQIVRLIGLVALVLSGCLGGALIGMIVVLIRDGRPDIAVIVAMFGTVQSIVTGAIGYLAPSPLQNASSRRGSDSQPAGTEDDPITAEVKTPPDEPLPTKVVSSVEAAPEEPTPEN
jgi:hypothetical protein